MPIGWLYTVDEDCQTPLSRAVNSNHMALTELLLRQDAEDQTETPFVASLVHRASSLGLTEALKVLLAEGTDVNELDKYGETPLHKAARHGHRDTAKVLIENGAHINAINVFGLTPLHWVALNGQTHLAELLLNAGADPRIADDYLDALTPISLAHIMGYAELAALLESAR